MKIFKVILISIGVLFVLFFAGIVLLLGTVGIVAPLDERYSSIRLLKTGKVDTLVHYTTSYELGDTITVFRNKTNYSDADELTNETGKTEKAVVLD